MAPAYRVPGRVSAMFACVNNLTGFACGWRILLWQRNHRTPSKCCWNLGPWNKVSVLQWGTSARERDWDRTVEFYSWKGPCRRVNSNLLPVEDPRLHQWQSDAETTCLLMPFFIPRWHSQLLTKHPYFLERVVKAGTNIYSETPRSLHVEGGLSPNCQGCHKCPSPCADLTIMSWLRLKKKSHSKEQTLRPPRPNLLNI